MSIVINSFSIVPGEIVTGENEVEVIYECELDDAGKNPVVVKLFVLSSLAVSFDVATWDDQLQSGANTVSTARIILANSVLTTEKQIKIKIRLEDSTGSVSSLNTFITYLP
jgi:hypothetical protein